MNLQKWFECEDLFTAEIISWIFNALRTMVWRYMRVLVYVLSAWWYGVYGAFLFIQHSLYRDGYTWENRGSVPGDYIGSSYITVDYRYSKREWLFIFRLSFCKNARRASIQEVKWQSQCFWYLFCKYSCQMFDSVTSRITIGKCFHCSAYCW